MSQAPLVTVLITAYNYGQYVGRAIESALAQDYPAESLDIVVIDDGSTDDTAEAIRPYLDHLRYIWQPNAGLSAATNRGVEEARGEFIGLLDADDMWLPDKVRRQVDVFLARPEVGLVAGELEIVDDDDRTVTPRYFQGLGIEPPSGRVLGTCMRQNLSPAPSIMVRASLKHAFHPILPAASYQDWWMAARIAERAEIVSLPDPVTRYRAHSGQMSSFGAHDEKWIEVQQKDNGFRRWMFRNLDLGRVTLDELVVAWNKLDEHLGLVASRWGVQPVDLLPVADEDRAAARALATRAGAEAAAGDLPAAARTLLAAMAEDPFDPRLREQFDAAARATAEGDDPVPADTRGFVVLAHASTLLRAPELLAAYGEAFGADDDATLVIDLGAEPPVRLSELVTAVGLDGEGSPDMLAAAMPARRAHALLTPGSVDSLRGIAERVWREGTRTVLDEIATRRISEGQAA